MRVHLESGRLCVVPKQPSSIYTLLIFPIPKIENLKRVNVFARHGHALHYKKHGRAGARGGNKIYAHKALVSLVPTARPYLVFKLHRNSIRRRTCIKVKLSPNLALLNPTHNATYSALRRRAPMQLHSLYRARMRTWRRSPPKRCESAAKSTF